MHLTPVNTEEILRLGHKCLTWVMDFYPATYEQEIKKNYLPVLEAEMQNTNTINPFHCAVPHYNSADLKLHKIWWLASAQYLLNKHIEERKIIIEKAKKIHHI